MAGLRARLVLITASATLIAAAPAAFDEQPAPPRPDYARPTSWAARPGAEGPATAIAPGATPAARVPQVDVFYVHPTTYRSTTQWNQDIADDATNRWTDASVVARQAGVFNGCCRVFAPRYRQGSSRSFTTMAGDGGKAFDLAYGDVLRAFDYYLAHDNHGRPFILAGHSQGAFHLARLIEERIDGTPLARRMVAAYIVGYNLSEGDFGRTYKTVTICATPTQTGCILQWNSVLPGPGLAAMATAGQQRYIGRYGDDPGKVELCINPLTFDRTRPDATADAAGGAVPGTPGFGPLGALRPHAVAARCDNGLLIVEPADLDLTPLPGGSMHYHDYGLFYAEIRADAARRSAAFLARQ